MKVYLLHFSTKFHHAQHYIGSTRDLASHIAQHRKGTGARLIEVINDAGISWQVARTWDGGWGLERYLKRQKNGPRLCPICAQQRAYKAIYGGGTYEPTEQETIDPLSKVRP